MLMQKYIKLPFLQLILSLIYYKSKEKIFFEKCVVRVEKSCIFAASNSERRCSSVGRAAD